MVHDLGANGFFTSVAAAARHLEQLKTKVSGYVTHYRGRERAELNYVLFVASDARREEAIRTAMAKQRERRPAGGSGS